MPRKEKQELDYPIPLGKGKKQEVVQSMKVEMESAFFANDMISLLRRLSCAVIAPV